ncbi:MAG: hypothetical protein JSU74_12640 [Candidatus Zixiibacteriota bacterium]|nr:MAG: hypothetical protein JSU74_12640 [candidate division Zixibacteria bacterium]
MHKSWHSDDGPRKKRRHHKKKGRPNDHENEDLFFHKKDRHKKHNYKERIDSIRLMEVAELTESS